MKAKFTLSIFCMALLSTDAIGQNFSCEGSAGTTEYYFDTSSMTVKTVVMGTTEKKPFSYRGEGRKLAEINYPEVAQALPDWPSRTVINLETGAYKSYSTKELKAEKICTTLRE